MFYNNDDQYGFYQDDKDKIQVVNDWFNGPQWKKICKMADAGSRDCLQLMEHVNLMLGSLIFHLQNESNPTRIEYEFRQFRQLTESLG